MKPVSNNLTDYLKDSNYIDYQHPSIKSKVKELKCKTNNDFDYIKEAYEFVRDQIHHSWDIQDSRITILASEVLETKVGICYAKANLLAALLRANHIPTGICYQRLTIGDDSSLGYCIHALNAVYLRSLERWIRVDARGNKKGVHAEFSINEEILAFKIRKEYDEVDYDEIYFEPAAATMAVLKRNQDALYMYIHDLPDRL